MINRVLSSVISGVFIILFIFSWILVVVSFAFLGKENILESFRDEGNIINKTNLCFENNYCFEFKDHKLQNVVQNISAINDIYSYGTLNGSWYVWTLCFTSIIFLFAYPLAFLSSYRNYRVRSIHQIVSLNIGVSIGHILIFIITLCTYFLSINKPLIDNLSFKCLDKDTIKLLFNNGEYYLNLDKLGLNKYKPNGSQKCYDFHNSWICEINEGMVKKNNYLVNLIPSLEDYSLELVEPVKTTLLIYFVSFGICYFALFLGGIIDHIRGKCKNYNKLNDKGIDTSEMV